MGLSVDSRSPTTPTTFPTGWANIVTSIASRISFIPQRVETSLQNTAIDVSEYREELRQLIDYNNIDKIKKSFSGPVLKELGYYPIDYVMKRVMANYYTAGMNAFDPYISIIRHFLICGCPVNEASAHTGVIVDYAPLVMRYTEGKDSNKLIPLNLFEDAVCHSRDGETVKLLHNCGVEIPSDLDPRRYPTVAAVQSQKYATAFYLHQLGYPFHSKCYEISRYDTQHSEAAEFVRFLHSKNIPIEQEGLESICLDGCLDIVEKHLSEGLKVSDKALARAMKKNQHRSVQLLLKNPPTKIGDCCLCDAMEYFSNDHKSFAEQILPLYDYHEKKDGFILFYTLLKHHKNTYLPLFISRFGYSSELLEGIFRFDFENGTNDEIEAFLLSCIDQIQTVTPSCIKSAFMHASEKVLTKFIKRFQPKVDSDTICLAFSHSPISPITLWKIFKTLGGLPNPKIVEYAFRPVHEDAMKFINSYIDENPDDYSEIDLRYFKKPKDLKHRLELFLRLNTRISSSFLCSFDLNEKEYANFFAKKVVAHHPSIVHNADLEAFCMACAKEIQAIKGRHSTGKDSVNLFEVMGALYEQKSDRPLYERVLFAIGKPELKWTYVHPHFSVPTTLLIYEPELLDIKNYNAILTYLKTNCNEGINTDRPFCAFKLSVIFKSSDKAIQYLENYKKDHPKARQPIHDACLFDIPKTNAWTRELWREVLDKNNYSIRWLKLLPFAPNVERFFDTHLPLSHRVGEGKDADEQQLKKTYYIRLYNRAKNDPKYADQFKGVEPRNRRAISKILYALAPEICPDDVDELVKTLTPKLKQKHKAETGQDLSDETARKQLLEEEIHFSELLSIICKRRMLIKYTCNELVRLIITKTYSDIPEEHYDFAIDCVRGGISKKTFDEIVEICTKQAKTWDFIPTIKLDGTVCGMPGYTIETLKRNDCYTGILGNMTACCQSVNNAGGDAALHGMKTRYGAFLAIKKPSSRKPWISQSWVGVTESGALVDDSLEHNKGHTIMPLYELAAKEMMRLNPKINGIYFGGGGNTPQKHNYPLDTNIKDYSRIIGFNRLGYDSCEKRFIFVPPEERQPESWEPQIPQDAMAVVEGVDTYVSAGKNVRGLALTPFDRALFFDLHPNALAEMRAHPLNPLLEEGHYETPEKREKYGEFFIPFDAAALIIREKLEKYATTNHLVLVDNNDQKLVNELRAIHLQEGQGILVGHVKGVHGTFAYIEKSGGTLRGVVADSEGTEQDVCDLIGEAFPGIKLRPANGMLQKDFYSCMTFVTKAMQAFAKEGHALTEEIFQGIVPAKLHKMSQYPIPENCDRNAIVSKKRNLTLGQYLQVENVVFHGSNYNASALRKKYKHLQTLERCLQNRTATA